MPFVPSMLAPLPCHDSAGTAPTPGWPHAPRRGSRTATAAPGGPFGAKMEGKELTKPVGTAAFFMQHVGFKAISFLQLLGKTMEKQHDLSVICWLEPGTETS